MPIRFFVPLPGPFVYTTRSRQEREFDREQRALRREAIPAAVRDRQRGVAALVVSVLLVIGAWLIGPVWGVLALVAVLWVAALAWRDVRAERRSQG